MHPEELRLSIDYIENSKSSKYVSRLVICLLKVTQVKRTKWIS